MPSRLVLASLFAAAIATRPFLNEPDTGFDAFLPHNGSLPALDEIYGLPDFDAAARDYMDEGLYAYYRNGAAGEWSYRNNFEVYGRFRFRPRVMVDITGVESTLQSSMLGYNFSVPFFIAPAARAGYAHPDAERNIMRAAEAENIAYAPSLSATLSIEEIAAVKSSPSFPSFQQLYIDNNDTTTALLIRRIEASGACAIFLTIDSAADGVRQRAMRYGQGSADVGLTLLTWERFKKIQAMTELPIVPKGIQTVEDARAAVGAGVRAIYLSNHGGRQLDHSPSSLEVAMEIFNQAPEIFGQVEVYADGGVRYGTDILKLLALGVKAVGVARPFYFANCYGEAGVRKAVQILRSELINDSGNLGVADLGAINSSFIEMNYPNFNGWNP